MLTHPTIDQLRALKLDGMADAFTELQSQDRAKDLDHAEWLALLLDREAANRNTKRFQSRLRSAKLRHGQASIEDVDYRTPRRLDKALFQQLAAGRWIADHRRLRLFFLPPYSPDRNPDELVWKHLKADTVGRMTITDKADFKAKVRASMRQLQNDPEKIRSFYQKPSLKYAA